MERMRVYKVIMQAKDSETYIEYVAAYSVEEAISKTRDDHNMDSVYSVGIYIDDVLV